MDRARLALTVALALAVGGLVVGGVVLSRALSDLDEARERAARVEGQLEVLRDDLAEGAAALAKGAAEREELQSEVETLTTRLASHTRAARKCVRALSEAGAGYAAGGYQLWIVDLLYRVTDPCEEATGEQFYPWLAYDF